MTSIPQNLCVPPGTTIRATLEAITKNGRQVALVTDPDDRLLGIVTDGDVRKALLRGAPLDAPIGENMNATPLTGRAGLGRAEAGEVMRARAHPAPAAGGRRRPAGGRDLLRRSARAHAAARLRGDHGGRHGHPAPAAHRGDAEAAAARGRAAPRRDPDRAARAVRGGRRGGGGAPQVRHDPGPARRRGALRRAALLRGRARAPRHHRRSDPPPPAAGRPVLRHQRRHPHQVRLPRDVGVPSRAAGPHDGGRLAPPGGHPVRGVHPAGHPHQPGGGEAAGRSSRSTRGSICSIPR